MTNAAIEAKLKNMIVDRLFLKVKPEEIPNNVSLMDAYGVDSVSLLELVVGLEEAFGVQVEDGDFNVRNFATVAALRDFVRARLP
jgi:acyl carrier protein